MTLNKPLVFYSASFYIGCLSYIAINDSFITGAAIAASFLIIIFLTVERKFSIVTACFFTIAFLISASYYSLIHINTTEDIRITKDKGYYLVGRVKGRNVILKGNLDKISEGDRILAYGEFEEQKDYGRGTLGTFYVDKYKAYKNDFTASLHKAKANSYNGFEKYLGKEKAAIVMSLCFGETAYLSEEQKYDFQELGVVHAISVSGFHMAVIYKLLEGLIGFQASMAVSLIYVIFTGSQPATVRAFLMILVLKLSKKVFRNYDSLSALSLSALLILSVSPYYVLDVGFILSYLSTLGIILYYDKIKRTLFKLPKSINESLSLTLSAQAFSMAYSGMIFSNISFGFIAGNIILLPMYTAVVVTGNMALLLIKIEYVFSIICKLVNIILFAVDGAQYLLLKVTPPVSDISWPGSLAILMLVSAFLLIKKGYEKFKLVPVFIIIMLSMQSYNFFPKVEYASLGGSDGIILSYRGEKVLIHNVENDFITAARNSNITRIIAYSEEEIEINAGKHYRVKVMPSEKNAKMINLEIDAFSNKTILARNTEEFMDVDLTKYDIIRVPKQKYYPFKGVVTNKLPKLTYSVVFSKVYSMNRE